VGKPWVLGLRPAWRGGDCEGHRQVHLV